MKKKLAIFFVCGILALSIQTFAQFLPEDVAEWPKWIEFMKAANITASSQMGGAEAVTSPWKLTLEKDGVTRNGLWKNPEGRMGGFIEGWRYEIAAYLMDQLIGLNMVAPTIEKEFNGNKGSLQLWVESEMTLKKKTENNVKTPSYKVFPWNRATYLQRFFDNLIGNEDRHMNNILITKDWRIYLIDHSRSFRTAKKFVDTLLYSSKGGKEGPKPMSELPRAIVDKVKALTFDSIKAACGETLKEDEINAVLKRRDLIVKEIDEMIKKNGEENVLY
jgi:hypothetical protein